MNILDLTYIGLRLVSALDSGKYDGITADLVKQKIELDELVEYLNEVLGVNIFSVLQVKEKELQELKEHFERSIGEGGAHNSGLCRLLWMVLEGIQMVSEHGKLG